MEPVRHPDTPVPIIWIGCSRRRRPTLTQKGSCSPPVPRSPTGCSSSASGICGRSWPSMRAITTGGDPIAAAISARPGPTTPSRTSPRSGSSAGLSSAASSMSTSEPHRSAGQDRRPSSGTPQVRRPSSSCSRAPVLPRARTGKRVPASRSAAPPSPIGLTAAALSAGAEGERADSRDARPPGTLTCARCPAVRSVLDARRRRITIRRQSGGGLVHLPPASRTDGRRRSWLLPVPHSLGCAGGGFSFVMVG